MWKEGAEDERALRQSIDTFESTRLVPNTLVDTSSRHQRTTLSGHELKSPLIIAPTGLNGMLSHRGDIVLTRAAATAGIPFSLSTLSDARLEGVVMEVEVIYRCNSTS